MALVKVSAHPRLPAALVSGERREIARIAVQGLKVPAGHLSSSSFMAASPARDLLSHSLGSSKKLHARSAARLTGPRSSLSLLPPKQADVSGSDSSPNTASSAGGGGSKRKAVKANLSQGTLVFGGRNEAEERLLQAVADVKGRGKGVSAEQQQNILDAIAELEAVGGVSDPVYSDLIEGSWKLLFTTRPGTASPIQRTFVGVDAFKVFQNIDLSQPSTTAAGATVGGPRVSNVVVFGDAIGRLKVEAIASRASGKRVAFQFDRAAFELKFWPYRFPYPVPFRLLGDEAKGWLDTSYLSPSGNLRISRGNKGTTFVLERYFSPQEVLLQAIKSGSGVEKAIEGVVPLNPTRNPARSPLSSGTWRLLWTSQGGTASAIQKFATSAFNNYQVVDEPQGRLDTLVQFLPGLVLGASATYEVVSDTVADIEIDSASLTLGPLKIPVGIRGTGNVDILYVDEKLRISRGDKGSLFVQQRDPSPPSWLQRSLSL